MFKSIVFEKKEVEGNNVKLHYTITDVTFIQPMIFVIDANAFNKLGVASEIPAILIMLYSKLNRDVAKNVALFYAASAAKNTPLNLIKEEINADKLWTDTYLPQVKYGIKYYHCIWNNLNKFQYIMGHLHKIYNFESNA